MLKIPSIKLIKTYVQQHRQMIFGPRWFSLAEVTDRLEPLIGWNQEALKASRVAVVGCGALGGNFALAIARYGVGEILLFDFDEVDPSNLPRQPFSYADVRINKALALNHHVRNARVDRETLVESFPYHFEEAVSANLVSTPSILFVGVDNDPSRRWAITYANTHRIPAIITGLDGEAAEGYVFRQQSQPDTPCPACFWPSLIESMGQAPCAPVSAAIALTVVGISLAALESLVMKRPLEWDVKTISLTGKVEGNYGVVKRSDCPLCASGEGVNISSDKSS